MWSIPRSVWIIVVAAFIVRLVFFGIAFTQLGESVFLTGDSRGFLRVAENIVSGHGISQSESTPFLPDSRFPPLFPLLIAGSLALFNSFVPVLILNIVAASFVPALVYLFGKKFTDSSRTVSFAVFLSAFEPLMIIMSTLLIPHALTLFLSLVSLYFFMNWLESKMVRDASISGMLLGLSTLIRPHSKFLFFCGVLFFVVYSMRRYLRKQPWKRIVLSGALFFATFVIVLTPWIARNYYYFGTIDVSSTGLRNVYTDFAVSLISYKTGEEYGIVEDRLEKDFALRHGITTQDIDRDPKWGNLLLREGVKIILENPKEAAVVFVITETSFFTQDLYMYFSQLFGITASGTIDFSPSLVLVREGPGVLFLLVWERLGFSGLIPLLGRAVWTSISLLALVGFFIAARSAGRERTSALFFGFLILYYASTSLVAAFSAHAYQRYPVNPFLFLFAGFAVSYLYETWQRRGVVSVTHLKPTSL